MKTKREITATDIAKLYVKWATENGAKLTYTGLKSYLAVKFPRLNNMGNVGKISYVAERLANTEFTK